MHGSKILTGRPPVSIPLIELEGISTSPFPISLPVITGLSGCFSQFKSNGSEDVASAFPECVP